MLPGRRVEERGEALSGVQCAEVLVESQVGLVRPGFLYFCKMYKVA
jgi:hypothetical protein